MRRRTARNRSTTPPPDTGLPAALRCGQGVTDVATGPSPRLCTAPRRRPGGVSGTQPHATPHAGVRLLAVTLGADQGPCTRSGAPRGSRILPRLCDPLRFLSPFGGAPQQRFQPTAPRSSDLDRPPAARGNDLSRRRAASGSYTTTRPTGCPVGRVVCTTAGRVGPSVPGPGLQRTRRRMNLLPNRVPMVFSSVAAVASL